MLRISRAGAAIAWVYAKGISLLGHDLWTLRATFQAIHDQGEQELLQLALEEVGGQGNEDGFRESLKQMALSPKDKKYDDGAALDAIVQVLQRAYGRNTVSAGTIDSLRNAFLIPSEVDSLAAEMEKVEAKCAGCAHLFTDGEVTVYRTESVPVKRGTSPTRKVLYCTRCIIPRWQTCHIPGCDGHVELPQKAVAVFGNSNQVCKEHQEQNKAQWIEMKKKGDKGEKISLGPQVLWNAVDGGIGLPNPFRHRDRGLRNAVAMPPPPMPPLDDFVEDALDD